MRVYFTNFFYYAEPTFSTLEAALAYGKERGFDFAVHAMGRNGGVLAAWSIIGGTRYFN